MPRRFLSKAERNRLSRFPTEVSDNDCIVYFTLTPADLHRIQQRRGDENHLGFALLLCSLRYLGVSFKNSIQKDLEEVKEPMRLTSHTGTS